MGILSNTLSQPLLTHSTAVFLNTPFIKDNGFQSPFKSQSSSKNIHLLSTANLKCQILSNIPLHSQNLVVKSNLNSLGLIATALLGTHICRQDRIQND